MKFHDGSDFTADDVVFTVNYVADEANGVKTQRNVNWMKSAEKVDDYTVRIMLKEKFPAAIEFLSGPVSMYPSDYYEEAGPEGMGLKPVGTGPYKQPQGQAQHQEHRHPHHPGCEHADGGTVQRLA